jgi:hypothetical protein
MKKQPEVHTTALARRETNGEIIEAPKAQGAISARISRMVAGFKHAFGSASVVEVRQAQDSRQQTYPSETGHAEVSNSFEANVERIIRVNKEDAESSMLSMLILAESVAGLIADIVRATFPPKPLDKSTSAHGMVAEIAIEMASKKGSGGIEARNLFLALETVAKEVAARVFENAEARKRFNKDLSSAVANKKLDLGY